MRHQTTNPARKCLHGGAAARMNVAGGATQMMAQQSQQLSHSLQQHLQHQPQIIDIHTSLTRGKKSIAPNVWNVQGGVNNYNHNVDLGADKNPFDLENKNADVKKVLTMFQEGVEVTHHQSLKVAKEQSNQSSSSSATPAANNISNIFNIDLGQSNPTQLTNELKKLGRKNRKIKDKHQPSGFSYSHPSQGIEMQPEVEKRLKKDLRELDRETNQHRLGKRGKHVVSYAQITDMMHMNPTKIRQLLLQAAQLGIESELMWKTAAERIKKMDNILYFDAIGIVKAFRYGAPFYDETLMLRMADDITAQASKLSIPHILDTITVYETLGLRPKVLYVEMFHNLIRLSKSMYAEEYSQVFAKLVELKLNNTYLVDSLCKEMLHGLDEFRLLHLMSVRCCLSLLLPVGLEKVPERLDQALLNKLKYERDCLSTEELYCAICSFGRMEYSYALYEALIWEEFEKRMAGWKGTEDVDTLAKPMDVLRMLHTHNKITDHILLVFNRWALNASYRPNTLSYKRPTARDLSFLHLITAENDAELEIIRERDGLQKPVYDSLTGKPLRTYVAGSGVSALKFNRKLKELAKRPRYTALELCERALRNFLASRGGHQKEHLNKRPLIYRKGRTYWSMKDPQKEISIRTAEDSCRRIKEIQSKNKDSNMRQLGKDTCMNRIGANILESRTGDVKLDAKLGSLTTFDGKDTNMELSNAQLLNAQLLETEKTIEEEEDINQGADSFFEGMLQNVKGKTKKKAVKQERVQLDEVERIGIFDKVIRECKMKHESKMHRIQEKKLSLDAEIESKTRQTIDSDDPEHIPDGDKRRNQDFLDSLAETDRLLQENKSNEIRHLAKSADNAVTAFLRNDPYSFPDVPLKDPYTQLSPHLSSEYLDHIRAVQMAGTTKNIPMQESTLATQLSASIDKYNQQAEGGQTHSSMSLRFIGGLYAPRYTRKDSSIAYATGERDSAMNVKVAGVPTELYEFSPKNVNGHIRERRKNPVPKYLFGLGGAENVDMVYHRHLLRRVYRTNAGRQRYFWKKKGPRANRSLLK